MANHRLPKVSFRMTAEDAANAAAIAAALPRTGFRSPTFTAAVRAGLRLAAHAAAAGTLGAMDAETRAAARGKPQGAA